jgi:hypothetical protein
MILKAAIVLMIVVFVFWLVGGLMRDRTGR